MKNTCNNHTNNSIIFVVKRIFYLLKIFHGYISVSASFLLSVNKQISLVLMNRNGFLLYIFLVILACISGCKKDNVVTEEGELSFSSDTVTFDTVFTTLGSATLSFKIYNRGSSTLRIRSISLAGAEHSFFHLNIDGESTRSCRMWMCHPMTAFSFLWP